MLRKMLANKLQTWAHEVHVNLRVRKTLTALSHRRLHIKYKYQGGTLPEPTNGCQRRNRLSWIPISFENYKTLQKIDSPKFRNKMPTL